MTVCPRHLLILASFICLCGAARNSPRNGSLQRLGQHTPAALNEAVYQVPCSCTLCHIMRLLLLNAISGAKVRSHLAFPEPDSQVAFVVCLVGCIYEYDRG